MKKKADSGNTTNVLIKLDKDLDARMQFVKLATGRTLKDLYNEAVLDLTNKYAGVVSDYVSEYQNYKPDSKNQESEESNS